MIEFSLIFDVADGCALWPVSGSLSGLAPLVVKKPEASLNVSDTV